MLQDKFNKGEVAGRITLIRVWDVDVANGTVVSEQASDIAGVNCRREAFNHKADWECALLGTVLALADIERADILRDINPGVKVFRESSNSGQVSGDVATSFGGVHQNLVAVADQGTIVRDEVLTCQGVLHALNDGAEFLLLGLGDWGGDNHGHFVL